MEIRASIFKTLREKETSVRINLLGIFNFISVSKLLLAGEVLYNHETGEVVVTDKVTAERIRATLHNFTADPEKLHRRVVETSTSPPPTVAASSQWRRRAQVRS